MIESTEYGQVSNEITIIMCISNFDKNSNNNPASSPVLSVRSTDSKSCSTTSSLNGSPRLQRFRNHPAATSSHFQVSSLNYIINPSGSINLQRQHSSPVAVAEPKKEKKKSNID